MRLSNVPAAVLVLVCAVEAVPTLDAYGWPWGLQDPNSVLTDVLAYEGLAKLAAYVVANGYPSPQKCTLDNVVVRSEWSTFSTKQKQEYVDAVKCMAEKPAKSSRDSIPGARNRYDDFVGVHINQTLSIHGTGNFLTWHRYFTWAYEQALRNECGYMGYQPYWNWPKYAKNPLASSLFDGSSASLGGNGASRKEGDVNIPSNQVPSIVLPPQQGGGCVEPGYLNWTVNLGPVSPALNDTTPNKQPDGLAYNPRCLRRDISSYVTQQFLKDADVSSSITNFSDIDSFQTYMQGNGFTDPKFLGIHTGGHFVVGADPGGDLFSSPGDPYFYLHHAMIDRVYWTWQNMDVGPRSFGDNRLSGTITVNNLPPSRNATLEDIIDLGVNAEPITIEQAMSTIGGTPFCYVYA
ncbi:MAG: hypothetical protein M1820_001273 [Bogoriella megaspora]|nr:MAG: hypothetical protein M1820_001273 [Bogoriella megaspora]